MMENNAKRDSGQSNLSDKDDGRYRNMRVTITGNTIYSGHSYSGDNLSFEKSSSQWEQLMRKFSKDNKKNQPRCGSMMYEEIRCEPRPLRTFPTGSQYEGTWDPLGMCGYGVYTYPNGVIYEGEFENNCFHGEGELRYPDGIVLRGRWNYGDLYERTVIFNDYVHYRDRDWTYCRGPDRRYAIEYFEGLQPGGNSFLTAEVPMREIPEGYYDCGDGFYDPKTRAVYKYDDLASIIRCPNQNMQDWIVANCRSNPYKNPGPLPLGMENKTDVKIEAETEPMPICISEPNMEDIEDVPSGASMTSLWRRQMSEASPWAKKASFRYDPSKANLDFYRIENPKGRPSQVTIESRIKMFKNFCCCFIVCAVM